MASITFQNASFSGTALAVTASYVTAAGVGRVEVTLQDQNSQYLVDGTTNNVNCNGTPQVLSYTATSPAVAGYTYILKIRLFNQSTGAQEAEYDGSVTSLPNEATGVNSDVAGTSAVLNWTPSAGAKYFRLVTGGSGANPPGVPSTSQGASTYSWLGSLLNSTTYSGLIQSSADNVNWTAGAAFSLTTTAANILSALQTASTTTTATLVIHPISATTTVTCPGFTVTPSGAQASTVTSFVISGLSPGATATATITPSAGAAITQPILAQPPAPTGLTAYQSGQNVTLTWTPPATIAGTPYLVINATPALPSQPLYPTYANPYTVTGIDSTVPRTFSLSFGQQDAGGSEGAITTAVQSGIVINNITNGKIYFTTFGSTVAPYTIGAYPPTGGAIEIGTTNTSPFTIPDGSLTSGLTYRFFIFDDNTLSAEFPYQYTAGGFGINGWFFSP